jgi:hypothetical protein
MSKRDRVAQIARELMHAGLRERLSMLLVSSYETAGLTALERWDLNFLARLPGEWWINHSTEIEVSSPDTRTLSEWIERCVRNWPEAGVWAVVLASEWITRAKPEELPELWLNSATSPAPMPLEARLALCDAIEGR